MGPDELSTDQAFEVIDRICTVSKPVLILSGGEPLMRADILDIIRYGNSRGLRMAMGSCGLSLDDAFAELLFRAGLKKIAISLDSVSPTRHDRFRGQEGAWERAVGAIQSSVKEDLEVQINISVTWENYQEVLSIIEFGKGMGVRDFQVFFVVPTGRGSTMSDITPQMYETMIRDMLILTKSGNLRIRPTCAPQFIRIADQTGVIPENLGRGCIAGLSYCRICPGGEVTPCPYLPINCGNILKQSFNEIWSESRVFKDLRDFSKLKGKCGICMYKTMCGGCRARAFGIIKESEEHKLFLPEDAGEDFLAEDPWCLYTSPGTREG